MRKEWLWVVGCVVVIAVIYWGWHQASSPPAYLYKVVSVEDWEASDQYVQLSAMDHPFVHLATKEQLPGVIDRFWKDTPEYVILKLKTKDLQGRLVFETNPGKTTRYYHLYDGVIPKSAVAEVNTIYQK